ncbi:MAG TPA: phospholipase D-like domain-containing protein, partial [Roseiflexaceae bacterium]|nr:phospholipase D-like domain-containing protein [Roseiflexaceae bacterium]
RHARRGAGGAEWRVRPVGAGGGGGRPLPFRAFSGPRRPRGGAAAGERDRLCAAGIRLRVEDWTGTLHNKYAIVDAATTSDPLVITGSTNWSASGVASNDENTIIVHDPAIAAAYAADFERLKAPISAAAFGCNLEDASAADTQLFLPWLRSPQNNQSPAATPTAVVGATPTPTPPPPSFSSCSTMPDVTVVPNWPVQIMAVDKVAETVTLRNAGAIPVDLNGWVVCSITGGQRHPGISGSLAPGESRVFTNNGGPIWNNSSSDPAALYDALGRLISFLAD